MTRISNKKKKDWLGYISEPRLKDITLQHTHQSGKDVKQTRGLGGKTIWQLDDISFDWCNIWLTKLCIYLGVIACRKTHILNIDASLKFHEGEGNLVAQCTLLQQFVCICYSMSLTWALSQCLPCRHSYFTGGVLLLRALPIFPSSNIT